MPKIGFVRAPMVIELTGCLTGTIPPFGSIFSHNIQTYFDKTNIDIVK